MPHRFDPTILREYDIRGIVGETLFPADARVYSVKPLVGHCQGAASAVEVAAAALSYANGFVPASPVVAPAHPQLLDGLTPMAGGLTVSSNNTTAASIPIALHEALCEGRLKRGDLLIMTAFGSGFTWASAAIRW